MPKLTFPLLCILTVKHTSGKATDSHSKPEPTDLSVEITASITMKLHGNQLIFGLFHSVQQSLAGVK